MQIHIRFQGFQIHADPDSGVDFLISSQHEVGAFYMIKVKTTLNPSQNADADPDLGTPKIRI